MLRALPCKDTYISQIIQVDPNLVNLPVRQVLECLLVLVVGPFATLNTIPLLLLAPLLGLIVFAEEVIIIA